MKFTVKIIGGHLDSLKDIIETKYDNVKKYVKRYSEYVIIWHFGVVELINEDILITIRKFKNAG